MKLVMAQILLGDLCLNIVTFVQNLFNQGVIYLYN